MHDLAMKQKPLLLLFAIFLIIDILVAIISPFFISASIFPYLDDLQKTGLPSFIYSFANFDGAIYLKIAFSGYLPLTQAFFPLYPLLIRGFSHLVPGIPLVFGLIISYSSLLGTLLLLRSFLKKLIPGKSIIWVLLFILAFPTSFFLQSVYTESLFLFLFACGLWSIQHKKWYLACICGIALGLTRLVGLFAVIPFAGLYLQQLNDQKSDSKISFKQHIFPYVVIVSPTLGFFIYSFYLQYSVGDFLAFFHLQPLSNAGRSTSLVLLPQVMYRYVKIFLTAQLNFQYFIAVIEFIISTGVGAVLAYDFWRIYKKKYKQLFTRFGLNLFSVVNLILPTLTGTLTSVPRYALMSISFFIVLGTMQNKQLKIILLGIFGLLHIILLAYFIQGYFVS